MLSVRSVGTAECSDHQPDPEQRDYAARLMDQNTIHPAEIKRGFQNADAEEHAQTK